MHPVKNAMENLRWVAYEEYTYTEDASDEEVIKPNDTTDSETDEDVSAGNLDSDDSESTEYETEEEVENEG